MSRIRGAIAAILVLCCFSVLADEVDYEELLKLNIKNVSQITLGMSEDQVRNIMGDYTSAVRDGPINNPWKTERMGDMTILHYLIRRHPPFTPLLENQTEAIIIKHDIVSGIGRGYLKAARETAVTNTNVTNPTSSTKSIEERLKTLKGLYESDTIDKATYEKQKQRIMDSI